ncbi:spore protease YyaC [Brevibacillus dissolubilis]|uniref:spore protease YyaC n=1 Tax=Brevibacillus dissolubilis TaxID=1844116 RepID=UPI001116C41A|nr:spore protease YyaC [Brevibacillus dissolubilis]
MNRFGDRLSSSHPPFKIEYQHDAAVQRLSSHLAQRFRAKELDQDIVVLCIGTDRSTGDALGPLVGTKLKSLYPKSLSVYGTLEDPVHAVNLVEKLDMINRTHENPLMIAIDACLGQFSNVGYINVADGPLKPGAGVKKELPAVGTFHITGIVNVGGFMEYFVLQNTRLHVVMSMAEVISGGIYQAANFLHNRPQWGSVNSMLSEHP